MLEVGIFENRDSPLESAFEYSLVDPIKEVNDLVCNFIQGEWNDLPLANPNEESIEVHHLLVEPCFSETFENDAMLLSSVNLENIITFRGTQHSAGNYDQGNDYGILEVNTELRRQNSKYDFMLERKEDKENLNASCDCSDYLLETLCTENSFGYSPNSQPAVENLESSCQIQCIMKGEDELILEFPCIAKTLAFPTMNHTNVPHESSHGADHASICSSKYLDAQKSLFDQQNSNELLRIYEFRENEFLSSENEDDIIISGKEGVKRVFNSLVSIPHTKDLIFTAQNESVSSNSLLVLKQGSHEMPETANVSVATSKRLRKPTRRYIEETSDAKPGRLKDQHKLSVINSKSNLLCARTEGKYLQNGAELLLYQDYPFMLGSSRAYSRKGIKQMEYHGVRSVSPSKDPNHVFSTFTDNKLQDDTSSDAAPSIIHQRRKHHRQWTVPEATKLVDGVSQHGVGRWTVIKKLLFPTSAYRTAVDLKDKWRNLVRACAADTTNISLVGRQKKHASAPIPQFILQRVRELSVVHPYPKNLKRRNALVTQPISTSHRRGRILHRRSFY